MTQPKQGKLMRSLCFGDIHWGRRNSSEVHNKDCSMFIEWLAKQAIIQKADHIIFMGDWFETRSSINVQTLTHAHNALEMLNNLDLPIFMIVGNHDCYFKNSRAVHSLIAYNQFSNITVIDDFTPVDNIGDGVLLVPYAFHAEYETSLKNPAFFKYKTWFGHFEFMGFVITGQNHKMLTGPNPAEFVGPQIFSGHFHKRQTMGNVTYIGNTFPMDYSDAGDIARGCMMYDHVSHTFDFTNWDQCPKYQRVLLSELIDRGPEDLIWRDARVRCYVDREIDYEQSIILKEAMIEEYDLREFVLEEMVNLNDVARDTQVELTEEEQLEGVDHLVVRLLSSLQTETIKAQKLVDIYNNLQVVSK